MTDSPWSNQGHAAAARPSANWGFFLLMSIVIGIVGALADWGLQQAGIDLGIVINLATSIVVTWLAGSAWLKKAGGHWDSQDRHKLAFAYTMVNLVCFIVVFGLAFVALSSPYGQEIFNSMGLTPEMLAVGGVMIAVILAIAVPIGLLIGYGIMRLVLFYIVGKGETAAAKADTFN